MTVVPRPMEAFSASSTLPVAHLVEGVLAKKFDYEVSNEDMSGFRPALLVQVSASSRDRIQVPEDEDRDINTPKCLLFLSFIVIVILVASCIR